MPSRIAHVINGAASNAFVSLADLGWQVGQGLRTGANRFFYCEVLSETAESVQVSVDPWLSTTPVHLPRTLLSPVIRRQQDLPGGLVAGRTAGRVFLLDGHALPEDIREACELGARLSYTPLAGCAAELVRRATQMRVGIGDGAKRVPELSAVVTNVRPFDRTRTDRPARYWYHLPRLAQRHVPDLLIARVNHMHPTAVLNQGLVVDANFSTLWPTIGAALPGLALVALLNTSWVVALLETTGTVLGGGALKVEATHLRSLPLPKLSGSVVASLVRVGTDLVRPRGATVEHLRRAADEIVEVSLADAHAEDITEALRRVSTLQLGLRNPRTVSS